MQSSVHGASSLTAHILRDFLLWYTESVGKDTHGTDAYGYDSTKNEASPGSLMLSHILLRVSCFLLTPFGRETAISCKG